MPRIHNEENSKLFTYGHNSCWYSKPEMHFISDMQPAQPPEARAWHYF